VVGEWGGALMAEWRRWTGAGSRGRGDRWRRGGRKGRARPEVGDGPTGGPHLSVRGREEAAMRAAWAESGLGRGVGLGG
jgi:hypothetical protein